MTNVQSAGSGNWNSGSSWVGGNAPAAADTVEILDGHIITLDGNINAIGATTIRSGGQLTVAYQMSTSAFANITVDSGGKIYASRSVSSLLRVNGKLTSNSSYGIDYGKSDDQISNADVAAYIEIVTASDNESYSTKGIVAGANNFLTMYGATQVLSSTLAGTESTSPENNDLVFVDDMALRQGSLADVTNGLADMIVLGQNPTLGVGLGAVKYQVDTYLVAGYNAGTKTITLGDSGAGQTNWPRGGSSGNGYDDVDVERSAGTTVHRISSNVGVRGSAYNLRPARLIQVGNYSATFTNCAIWWGYYAVYYGSITYEGVVSFVGCYSGHYAYVSSSINLQINGTVIGVGCNYCLSAVVVNLSGTLILLSHTGGLYNCVIYSSGTIKISGCSYALNYGKGDVSGTIEITGCSTGINEGRVVSNATLSIYGCVTGIAAGKHAISGNATIANCDNGLNLTTCRLMNTNFVNNNRDIVDPIDCECYGIAVGASDIYYTLANLPQYCYSESLNHDDVEGAFKALTKGGLVESTTAIKPDGKNWSLKLQPASTTDPVYYRNYYTLAPGETLTLNIWIKKDASMTYLPWVAIIDPTDDVLFNTGGTALDKFTMENNTDWQTDTLTYTNSSSYDKKVVVCTVAKNGSGNVYFYWERSISSGEGGAGGASVLGSSIIKAVI